MLPVLPRRRLESMMGAPLAADWFDRFFEEFRSSMFGKGRDEILPDFDLVETENHITLKADLPGIDVKDLDIGVADNILTVTGSRREEHREENERYHRMERHFGTFQRNFTLPADVNAEQIDATYRDGVLTITIPKTETAKMRKIEVKVN